MYQATQSFIKISYSCSVSIHAPVLYVNGLIDTRDKIKSQPGPRVRGLGISIQMTDNMNLAAFKQLASVLLLFLIL